MNLTPLRTGAPLNPVRGAQMYASGAEGYTDYPVLAAGPAAA
ncbi:hypothetical protein OG535_15340 [Kitasatospora sp. NBC_00085]